MKCYACGQEINTRLAFKLIAYADGNQFYVMHDKCVEQWEAEPTLTVVQVVGT